jgi:hypothetical protein
MNSVTRGYRSKYRLMYRSASAGCTFPRRVASPKPEIPYRMPKLTIFARRLSSGVTLSIRVSKTSDAVLVWMSSPFSNDSTSDGSPVMWARILSSIWE